MKESTRIHKAPIGEQLNNDWKLYINGDSIPVYSARVSAMPFNRTWPGKQRPVEQTEEAGFAYWDMEGPVNIEAVTSRPVDSVVVRPRSKGIVPEVDNGRICFSIDKPCHLTVEVNGTRNALHLFANPLEENAPDPADETVLDASVFTWKGASAEFPDPDDYDVIYFPPGVHEAGRIMMRSGQRIHIAAGAVVYGVIEAHDQKDISITGRGVLDGSLFGRVKEFGFKSPIEPYGIIALYECENVLIEGVILRDPNVYACTPAACRHLRIDNIKLVGLWRYNSDGIDLHNCQDAVITKCFVRAFDDCIVLKGVEKKGGHSICHLPIKDISVSECVVWNDWGRALEIGAETWAPEYENIVFRDCDIIHTCHIAIDIQAGDNADIHDVLFEDIRVEMDCSELAPVYQDEDEQVYVDPENGEYVPRLFVLIVTATTWTTNDERGFVHDIILRDISVAGDKKPVSWIKGYDKEHRVHDVLVENLEIGGKKITDLESGNVKIGDHVGNVEIR